MHGKSSIKFGQVDMVVYPKRKLNRFESYLSVKFNDFLYN